MILYFIKLIKLDIIKKKPTIIMDYYESFKHEACMPLLVKKKRL